MTMDQYSFIHHHRFSSIRRWRLLFAVTISWPFLSGCINENDIDDQLENALFLSNLPANRWVKYQELQTNDWWRKGHAGLAYDLTRGSLLVFGSDTHGEDWDNVVHEFIPLQRKWLHHGVNSPSGTYRVDTDGKPIAGETQIKPWAMHTYDGVNYSPLEDALVIVASPDHNPIGKNFQKSKSDPIWIYNLQAKNWSPLELSQGNNLKNYFGAATAYDNTDNILYICKSGLWGLNITKGLIEKVDTAPNCLHRTLVFDSWRRYLYLFGSYKGTANISRYKIGFIPEEHSNWEELKPGGDQCPPYSKVPVAFDENSGVFLFVTDERKNTKTIKSKSTSTYIYDPETNTYKRLPNSNLPAVGMNFMMIWSELHKVFFLLTGNWKNGITVWALRLDKEQVI